MSHRAAIYTVRVHPLYRPKELRRFGNFDLKGTGLAGAVDKYFSNGFAIQDGDRSVEAVSSTLDGDDLDVVFKHGITGQAADIYNSKREKRLHQNPDDSHEVSTGAYFQLPRGDTMGWLAVHVDGIRSPKQLVYRELSTKFRSDYDPLKLLVSPAVSSAALVQAVEAGQVNMIKLTRIEKPTDVRKRITDKWVRKDQRARIETVIKAGMGEHVLNNLLLDYLKGKRNVRQQITEFAGADYDTAQVEVELDSGATRTFNIETPEAGHAFTIELDQLTFKKDGEPEPSSLFSELRRAIAEML